MLTNRLLQPQIRTEQFKPAYNHRGMLRALSRSGNWYLMPMIQDERWMIGTWRIMCLLLLLKEAYMLLIGRPALQNGNWKGMSLPSVQWEIVVVIRSC